MITLNNIIQKTVQGIQKHLENWRKYQHLWKQDRPAILLKFQGKAPPIMFFEKKLEKYNTVLMEGFLFFTLFFLLLGNKMDTTSETLLVIYVSSNKFCNENL